MTVHRTHAPFSFAVPMWEHGEDLDACRAAVMYLAGRVSAPTFEKLAALLYLADRAHLSHYGALMFGGAYEAMRHGPTPTPFLRLTRAGLSLGEAPDMDELSPATLEALDSVTAQHGQARPEALSALSRDEAWATCPPGEALTAARIAATLPNARAVLDYLADPHP